MKKRIKEFDGGPIRVLYDIPRCIHVAQCVERLPKVFDKDRRPWIDPNQGAADTVVAACTACPTGALKFERLDGGAAEAVPTENIITISADGPLYVHGNLEVLDADGNVLLRDTRIALCRCGASANKPLCDGRHEEAGFSDAGANGRPSTDEPSAAGPLQITILPNSPLLLSGPYRVVDAAGVSSVTMVKGALCRCGASASKPFCDGSHVAVGFQAD